MSPPPDAQVARVPAAQRLARAQAAIRELTSRGKLSLAQRLQLAEWQREWVQAWRDEYVTAA